MTQSATGQVPRKLHAEPHNRSIYEPVYGAPKKEWVLSASDPIMVAAHGRRLLAKKTRAALLRRRSAERSAERTMVGPAERSGQVPHPLGCRTSGPVFAGFTKPPATEIREKR